MDEPSTGLDPASRYNLWSVVKDSKQDHAIILTSMLPLPTLQNPEFFQGNLVIINHLEF